MSQSDTLLTNIDDRLRTVYDFQAHHRLREVIGYEIAKDLNKRVLWWSLGQTAIVVFIGVGQVCFLIEKLSKILRCFYCVHSSQTNVGLFSQ